MDPIGLKTILLAHCRMQITSKMEKALQAIVMLQQSSAEDTKSSAGDKYETGREMIQQEIEKMGLTVTDARQQLAFLARIDPAKPGFPGSIFVTDKANFFISVSASPVVVEGTTYQPVSTESPIARQLALSKEGGVVAIAKTQYFIKAVC